MARKNIYICIHMYIYALYVYIYICLHGPSLQTTTHKLILERPYTFICMYKCTYVIVHICTCFNICLYTYITDIYWYIYCLIGNIARLDSWPVCKRQLGSKDIKQFIRFTSKMDFTKLWTYNLKCFHNLHCTHETNLKTSKISVVKRVGFPEF
jgi:hypothetical protein